MNGPREIIRLTSISNFQQQARNTRARTQALVLDTLSVALTPVPARVGSAGRAVLKPAAASPATTAADRSVR